MGWPPLVYQNYLHLNFAFPPKNTNFALMGLLHVLGMTDPEIAEKP
jgi:hypothetical protein